MNVYLFFLNKALLFTFSCQTFFSQKRNLRNWQIALYFKIAKMTASTSRKTQQITAIYGVISGLITPVTFRPILQLNETLTDGGDQIQEALLGEKRVLQPSEIQLENASHRVDVMIALIINQWVLTWNKWCKNSDYRRKTHTQTPNI